MQQKYPNSNKLATFKLKMNRNSNLASERLWPHLLNLLCICQQPFKIVLFISLTGSNKQLKNQESKITQLQQFLQVLQALQVAFVYFFIFLF